MRNGLLALIIRGLLLASINCAGYASAQGVNVTAKIATVRGRTPHSAGRKPTDDADTVVMWLTSVQPGSVKPAQHEPYRLAQKDKQFTPHLLVVPTGTSVEFPNQDAFFHNVFSLFNGKRFDLGLYEAGATRSVRFDREGVSYIFCNIHPKMGAVILSLSTPYYATASPNSTVTIPNVPPGSYRLNIWSQNAEPDSLKVASRTIQISSDPVDLGAISVRLLPEPMTHTNKFGEPYAPEPTRSY